MSPKPEGLEYGKCYNGVISRVSPDTFTCDVSISSPVNAEIPGCVWGVGFFSRLIGVQGKLRPVQGTHVSFAYNEVPVIFATIPTGGRQAGTRNAVTGQTTFNFDNKLDDIADPRHDRETHGIAGDQLGGELDLTNFLGVGIQILTTFSKLCAGDRAKVEVCLLNDMVRILSETYRHHSAFGDEEIYNDGRANHIQQGTSYTHETWGLINPGDPKASADEKGVDFKDLDAVKDTGRWRWHLFRGWLGNFISTWVTDPPKQMGRLAEDALQAGRFRAQVTPDGTFLLQSVSDIVMERVVRIPVPVRLKRPEDPEGVKPEDFEKLNKQMLKLWTTPKTNVFETAFQLRQYARHLSQYMSMCRFLQMDEKGEWKVVSEADTPAHEISSETDVLGENSQEKTYDTYATIRIMRDGSIVTWAGDGTAVVHGGGNLWFSAPKNLHIEAGGDITMMAGQNIYMTARRNFDIVALVGGLRLKARTWWHALCELGTLWIKSDAPDINVDGEIPNTKMEASDPDPILMDASILINATKGCTTVDSDHTLLLNVSGSPVGDGDTDRSASVLIKSKNQHVDIHAGKSFLVDAFMQIGMKARQYFEISAISLWLKFSNRVLFGTRAELSSAGIMKAFMYKGDVIVGKTSIQGPDRPGPTCGPDEHFNHIDKLGDTDTEVKGPDEFSDVQSKVDALEVQFDAYKTGKPTWRFEISSDYVYSPSAEGRALYQSHAQQWIKYHSGDASSDFQTFTVPKLLDAPMTDSGKSSWPGADAKHKVHTDGDNLNEPCSKRGAELATNTPLTLVKFDMQFYKRQS